MAKTVRFVITGDKQVNHMLAQLKNKDARDAVRKASRTIMKMLLPVVQAATPRLSGALSRDLKVRAIKRSRSRIGAMVTTGAGHFFKGKTFYGGFQEWGWKTGARRRSAVQIANDMIAGRERKPTVRRKVPGKFFMKSTADKRRQALLTRYRIELRKLIEAEAEQYL